MVRTRKKVIKTIYKEEDDSDAVSGDFSDSGSDVVISEDEESSDGGPLSVASSENEFQSISTAKPAPKKKASIQKSSKINFSQLKKRMTTAGYDHSDEDGDVKPALFSVKDMTEADKLLPSVLNLSDSDSSDDEASPNTSKQNQPSTSSFGYNADSNDENECSEYKDVWSKDNSEEVAKKTFMELEQHKSIIEEAKASVQKYSATKSRETVLDIKDLLAQGEVFESEPSNRENKKKKKKAKQQSDSEVEDWEEVNETKAIPSQGLQLIVDFPDAAMRKVKKIDVEMMMRRKINRVKKEYQVYMHKVHVLSWIGHGNYVSKALNDQDILSAVLSLVPSKECYPGERVDMKYVEQITTWFKDKLTLKQDKNEDKFRPKAPPLIEILLQQIKSRVVTTKKYLVYIFVALLRAMGLQCRIMLNFVTVPIKPPNSELCSLSTKEKEKKDGKEGTKGKDNNKTEKNSKSKCSKKRKKIAQLDGTFDSLSDTDEDYENIIQLDGNDDTNVEVKSKRITRSKKTDNTKVETVIPPKKAKIESKEAKNGIEETKTTKKSEEPKRKSRLSRNTTNTPTENKNTDKLSNGTASDKTTVNSKDSKITENKITPRSRKTRSRSNTPAIELPSKSKNDDDKNKKSSKNVKITVYKKIENIIIPSPRKTRSSRSRSNTPAIEMPSKSNNDDDIKKKPPSKSSKNETKQPVPEIKITDENMEVVKVKSKFFENKPSTTKLRLSRKRSHTSTVKEDKNTEKSNPRSKSAPSNKEETSKYFDRDKKVPDPKPPAKKRKTNQDSERVSHRDLKATSIAKDEMKKIDVTGNLVDIIKIAKQAKAAALVKQAKVGSKNSKVKTKKQDSDNESDYISEEDSKCRNSESDTDFKPSKISPKPRAKSAKIDRRVLSPDEETPKNKIDVWCEVFVEELEQWIAVDVIKAQVHCTKEIYNRATHPVAYVIGWDNNNYLKDLTQRYVPHWNTVTRKQRAEVSWWETAITPWKGPRTARDREEDEQLDRMQMEAPLPKSIAEYKNHPLYALKRHLLKFEAIYPPDAATLGFIRNEAVYARDCIYVCRSRDTWLKEAQVVRIGEKPYKVVKARPKWDKLSNKMIDGLPLEVFGPWQVQDYEPPTAENGIVPRNAYGNVELFKECMLPKGTVQMKLPGLNKVAKKLNIDCAPAMTGFDYNGGYSHPVYDGYVVCQEFEEPLTEAWLLDQEEQERKENEKLEARVYGNWKRLIKGLLIRERLKYKYGFEKPTTSSDKKKTTKGPSFVAKKRK